MINFTDESYIDRVWFGKLLRESGALVAFLWRQAAPAPLRLDLFVTFARTGETQALTSEFTGSDEPMARERLIQRMMLLAHIAVDLRCIPIDGDIFKMAEVMSHHPEINVNVIFPGSTMGQA